jgi:predicted PolB exonuclease-like 3'-5' exonuclease
MSYYANYTQLFNDFSRRFRQPLTDDLQLIRFINGMANFQLHAHAKSHHSHEKGYNMPVVELQNFLNNLVTDSPHFGRKKRTYLD